MFQKHVKPSGVIIDKTFLYNGSIKKIDADIQAVINVVPEKRSEVSYSADENILDYFTISVSNGLLEIYKKKRVDWGNAKLVFNVGADALEEVYAGSMAQIAGEGMFASDSMKIHADGMSAVALQVHVSKIRLTAAGMSKIKLTGSTEDVTVKSSGMSEIDAKDMAAKTVHAAGSGMSKIKVYAEKRLKGAVSGMSNVTYFGKEDVSVSVATSGMSSVTKGEVGNG